MYQNRYFDINLFEKLHVYIILNEIWFKISTGTFCNVEYIVSLNQSKGSQEHTDKGNQVGLLLIVCS